MKKKVFLITIALCAVLQSNIDFASENQSWGDWLKAKYTQWTKKTTDIRPALTTAAVAGTIATQGRALLPYSQATLQVLGRPIYAATVFTPPLLLYAKVGIFLITVDLCGKIINQYRRGTISKEEAIKDIQNNLMVTINQELLYPTRSSKLHALLKKDEFLQYINDKDGLVQEACNELIREINAIPYSSEQKENDAIIDDKMAEARIIIAQTDILEEQIKFLEDYCKDPLGNFDIPGMQGYLSVYFRLKNKQAVENKLSPEEQASRKLERSELQKARTFLKTKANVSEPSVD